MLYKDNFKNKQIFIFLLQSGIYAFMGLLSVYLIRQPTDDWVSKMIQAAERKKSAAVETVDATANKFKALVSSHVHSHHGSPESSPTKSFKKVSHHYQVGHHRQVGFHQQVGFHHHVSPHYHVGFHTKKASMSGECVYKTVLR